MTHLTELQIAEAIARAAHLGQFEESTGDPYIQHVERVVALVEGDEAKAVAWLHDVLEDNDDYDGQRLEAYGISPEVVAAVVILTRIPGTPTYEYVPYIQSILASNSLIAMRVKIADLKDHLRPNCPERLRPRYEHALGVLMGTLERYASAVRGKAERDLDIIRTLCVREGLMNDEGTTLDMVRTMIYASQKFQRQRDSLAGQLTAALKKMIETAETLERLALEVTQIDHGRDVLRTLLLRAYAHNSEAYDQRDALQAELDRAREHMWELTAKMAFIRGTDIPETLEKARAVLVGRQEAAEADLATVRSRVRHVLDCLVTWTRNDHTDAVGLICDVAIPELEALLK